MPTTHEIAVEFGVAHADVITVLPFGPDVIAGLPQGWPFAKPALVEDGEPALEIPDNIAQIVRNRLHNQLVDVPPVVEGSNEVEVTKVVRLRLAGLVEIRDVTYLTQPLLVNAIEVKAHRGATDLAWVLDSVEVSRVEDEDKIWWYSKRHFLARSGSYLLDVDAPEWLVRLALRALEV